MNGGLIGGEYDSDGNTVFARSRGAGGVTIVNGSFAMYGGTIQSNSGSGSTGGLASLSPGSSGGVSVLSKGTFIMYRGTITKNHGRKGGGVSNYQGTFTMDGAEAVISDNSFQTFTGAGGGGGVYNDEGTFTMNNGTIQRNTAEGNYSSGGVYSVNATFIMNNGIIQENTTEGDDSGGGVYAASGTFIMNNGIIQENTAEGNNSGGGVRASGTFTMNNGTIQENMAVGNASSGGVYSYGAAFTMNNGIITENRTQDTTNYGVFLLSWSSSVVVTMTIKGPARVTADNPVFLSSSFTIIIIGDNLDNDPPLPAATIKHASPSGTTRLLRAGSFELIEDNIGKFQYAGGGNHIIANPTEYSGTWYGLYQ
jgi:hypothetical protein